MPKLGLCQAISHHTLWSSSLQCADAFANIVEWNLLPLAGDLLPLAGDLLPLAGDLIHAAMETARPLAGDFRHYDVFCLVVFFLIAAVLLLP